MKLEQKLEVYRISESEYEKIKEILGREPRGIEWALFSALWSEHCSYKSSKVHLKKFYSKSARVLQGFGENAGVIDLGEGEKVAFKMESHNHPSFIEPYQGAATGVGGILRDIFTMGARPIALANYLCFGEPSAQRMPDLVDGVVRGIGGYGNCVGVPTITGQTEFHKSYNGNILVNAFACGYFGKEDPVVTSAAKGEGNYVVYVGAKTGRDGVHGASMASESFAEDSEAKKPTVQIGDPFFEKLLIESCLEVMKKNLVVSIQDMGAAGLTSSSFEMASKGGVGLRLDLGKVPVRDAGILPEEILLSESQERMLLICEPSKFEELKAEFDRWDLDAAVIGEVLAERVVELYWQNERLTKIDPDLLTENAPMYNREFYPWEPEQKVDKLEEQRWEVGALKRRILDSLESIEGCSRQWVYEQYDQSVGASTIADASRGVAAVALPESGRPLGIVLGCRPYVMRMDARLGGADSVLYPAFELAAKGFEPLAVTDCLNFGNPEKPKLMSEFVAAVESMSEACEALETPVISGNVSLYNETMDKNVTSTPSTGVVGLRDDVSIPDSTFSGDNEIYLVQFGGLKTTGLESEVFADQTAQFQGELDLPKLAKSLVWLRNFINVEGAFSSRIVGKFGLGYTLARMCQNGVGAKILHSTVELDLTSETLYQVIIEADRLPVVPLDLLSFVEVKKIGVTKEGHGLSFLDGLEISVQEIGEAYESGWRKHFESLA